MAIQYKRILLKVSGEALSGPKGTGFDEETIASICAGIKAAHDLGAQIVQDQQVTGSHALHRNIISDPLCSKL